MFVSFWSSLLPTLLAAASFWIGMHDVKAEHLESAVFARADLNEPSGLLKNTV